MVALQSLVAMGVLWGTIVPACGSSDQCPQAGTFCAVGVTDRCQFCGDDHPLLDQTDPATGGTLNAPNAPDFAGFNLTAVAELCAGPSLYKPVQTRLQKMDQTHTTSSVVSWCKSGSDALGLVILGPWRLMNAGRRRSLRPPDRRHGGPADRRCSRRCQRRRDGPGGLGRSALRQLHRWAGCRARAQGATSLHSLASLSRISRSICGEVPWLSKRAWRDQDIALCAIAIAHAGDRLGRGSRLALALLGGVRRWLFLPTLVVAVPFLVLIKGGDALSVCFNTIAILFLTEVMPMLKGMKQRNVIFK